MASRAVFRYTDEMSSAEVFGNNNTLRKEAMEKISADNVNEFAAEKSKYKLVQTGKKMKEMNEKLQQLERVENNPLLLRTVLVSEPCDIRLPNGMNGRLTNVPAVFYVRRRTELGVDLANANGELVGHVERTACREWNARYVFRPAANNAGRSLQFFRSAEDCQNGRDGVALPGALQQPNLVFPILEMRHVRDRTYYLVSAPLRNNNDVEMNARFPAWVTHHDRRGGLLGEEGLLTTLTDRRVFAAAIENAIQMLPAADRRDGNDTAIENAVARMRMAYCSFITGQEFSDATQFNDAGRRQSVQGLPSVEVECFYQTRQAVRKMVSAEYNGWIEHLQNSVTRLRVDPEGERYTLHNAGAGRSAWQFIRSTGLP